jgi:hypothetical protein
MKAFMISMVLIVAASIYLITSYDKIADAYLGKALAEEGTPEAMAEAAIKDEAAFSAKYRPMLETRWTICNLALFLDDGYFRKLSKESLDRYKDTPLKMDPAYGKILFQRAQMMEEFIKPPQEAFYLFKEHNENFGTTPEAAISRSALIRLSI